MYQTETVAIGIEIPDVKRNSEEFLKWLNRQIQTIEKTEAQLVAYSTMILGGGEDPLVETAIFIVRKSLNPDI